MKPQKAKSQANSIRNRSKKRARQTQQRRERHAFNGMMSCLTVESLPVLDLMGYGGNSSVKAQTTKVFGLSSRKKFTACIAAAFDAANL